MSSSSFGVGFAKTSFDETMPYTALDVSDLQQRTSMATVQDLLRESDVLLEAEEYCRQGLDLRFEADVRASHDTADTDSSRAGQRDRDSHQGYALLPSTTDIYDGPVEAQFTDWSSTKVKLNTRSTFRVEIDIMGVDGLTKLMTVQDTWEGFLRSPIHALYDDETSQHMTREAKAARIEKKSQG